MYGSVLLVRSSNDEDESLPPIPISGEEDELARPKRPNHKHGPAAPSPGSNTDAPTHLFDGAKADYHLYRDCDGGPCNDTTTSSSGLQQRYPYCALLFILLRQLGVAIVVCKTCTDGAKRWADYQCDTQLSTRPPPYYWQDDEVIVLREDLSYPLSPNTISSAISFVSD